MTSQRNAVIPAVYVHLRKKDKVFLLRRYNTGFQDGSYTLITGHVDHGESPIQAVCREAGEEAGISIKPQDVKFEQALYRRSFDDVKEQFNPDKPERLDLFFSVNTWIGTPKNREPEKCDNAKWFPEDKLPEKMFPIVREFLMQYGTHASFRESGFHA